MQEPDAIQMIRAKYSMLHDQLDERTRRLWAAAEAHALGHGGTRTVSKAAGMSETTIRLGRRELAAYQQSTPPKAPQRIRHPGGGRKPLTTQEESILQALDALVEPSSRGDPVSPLRWTCKSTRKLEAELQAQGFHISHTKVGQFLKDLGYSLQSTRKRYEGKSHPDRDAQFAYINTQVKAFQQRNQPVVSVDTKKKELVGNFANKGREYQPQGRPEEVEAYDFPSLASGKGIPYGLYDMTANTGWVSVGTTHATAQFAVATLRQWWLRMGGVTYPHATELLLTADSGGSNGTRCRLWKTELQKLADETGLKITVCHFPPGTSKWNKIEHRMFCHITGNWRGRPLRSYGVVVNLIANTTTSTGLTIAADLDTRDYPTGIKITDEQMRELSLTRHSFHGCDWHYSLEPRRAQ
jgi:transposase